MADHGHVVARSTTERTTVGSLVFDVGEDGTLGSGVEGQDVADGERCVLSGVDELFSSSQPRDPCPSVSGRIATNLASVHALVRDEGLGLVLKPVWLHK